jgi:hypothetical protein
VVSRDSIWTVGSIDVGVFVAVNCFHDHWVYRSAAVFSCFPIGLVCYVWVCHRPPHKGGHYREQQATDQK